jgi:hypothetical protein
LISVKTGTGKQCSFGFELLAALLVCALPGFSQSQPIASTQAPVSEQSPANPLATTPAANASLGTINGIVTDKTGGAVVGAKVTLFLADDPKGTEAFSSENGQFSFANLQAGTYRVSVTAASFADQMTFVRLKQGETSDLAPIVLTISALTSDVDVTMTSVELAQVQVKEQEQQRLIGILPNFYVSYVPDAQPMTPKQKFQLALRTTVDPVSFGFIGAVAGVQQWQDIHKGFGQGAEGYAKRYGAAYGTFFTSTMMSGAVLPSLFKQDPRYFYKGTGSTSSRFVYAVSRVLITKGDNGRAQPNYSGLLGSLASAGISNLYYPKEDRNGVSLTFQNLLIDQGFNVLDNILQEFVFKKITPKVARNHPDPPKN